MRAFLLPKFIPYAIILPLIADQAYYENNFNYLRSKAGKYVYMVYSLMVI